MIRRVAWHLERIDMYTVQYSSGWYRDESADSDMKNLFLQFKIRDTMP